MVDYLHWWDYIPTGAGGPDWQQGASNLLQNEWAGGWQAAAILAVMASFFIVAIGWMVASAFNHAGLKRWIRSEIYQVLANAYLVIGLMVIVGVFLGAVSSVTIEIATASGNLNYVDPVSHVNYGTVNNPFVLAELFLDENIQCLRAWFLNVYLADSFIEPMEHANIGVAGMDAVSASTVLSPITGALYFSAHNSSFLLIINYFQRHLFIFIYQTMFTIFLPIGIILRTLPVTRGLGGFIIALAIGLYVVYPVSFAALLLGSREMPSGQCSLMIDAREAAGIHITSLDTYEYHRAKAEHYLPLISNMIDIYNNSIPFLVFRSFLFPLIGLTLVFTFVRATAGFFGADIAEVGRGLIKLI
ncbi:Uncharacterised protein [Candidatus Burarchaeum australiense]|nr:Uncharacterised protein [Candidatus Burarchaeum australiense]